ncbi:hypothetical protein [Streptomyces canus]|uniref:hypothetical protein n=1 Tax=Streptomyces canus TaxID=58343 RepID=UPI002DD824ED|nr:hypothetical protein [Streptomyces canus]WSD87331.1 hypothetical protein OG925_24835 [Streptomyces canus]
MRAPLFTRALMRCGGSRPGAKVQKARQFGRLLAVPPTAAASGVVDELRERYSEASPEDS